MMTKKYFTTFILSLFFNSILFTQNNSIISSDSILKIAKTYIDVNLDTSILISEKAIFYAVYEKDSITEAKSYINIGLCNDFSGNYSNAIKNYKIALEKFTLLNDYKGMGMSYNLLGISYFKISDFKNATFHYELALKYFELSDYIEGIAGVLNGMGSLYFDLNDYDKADEFYTQSLNLKRGLNDSIGIVNTLLNKAEILILKNKKFDLALNYINESEQICLLKKNERRLADCYSSKSNLHLSLKEYDNAFNFSKLSLEINNKLGNKAGVCSDYIALAEINSQKNEFIKAVDLLNLAEQIALEINAKYYLNQIYKKFSTYHSKMGNDKKALEYLNKHIEIKDEINSIDSKIIVENLKTSYETEKKDQEIVLLEESNKVNLLEIQNAKNTKYFLFVSTALLLLILGFIFNQYRLKNKISILLSKKNKELEISNAAKDRIFAIISHDLKGPVKSFETISSIIYANFNQLPSEKILDLIQKMHQTSYDLQTLLINLLNWAKSQQGYTDKKNEKFNLQIEVENIISLYQFEIEKKNIKIINSVPHFEIKTDKNIIHIVLRNIIQNAIKFSSIIQPFIEIKSEIENNFLTIKIIDNGIGMTEEDYKLLFKIENDVSKIGKSIEKGSGIGLYLCSELIQLLNGEIQVKSEINKGSTFFIKIPIDGK